MKISGWWIGVWAVTAAADPVFILPNDILAPGHGEVRLSYSNTEFLKRYDGSSGATDFTNGESRRHTLLPMMARYTLPGGEEVLVKATYADVFHRDPTLGALSRTGFGDLLVMARSHANLWGDLRGALGIGMNFPTGRGSVFEVGANEAPIGDGAWEGVASFAWSDRRQSMVFHAEVTYFLRLPRAVTRAMNQTLTDEVRFGFNHRFQGGISMEVKVSDALVLFGELMGRLQLEQTGTYVVSGGNAAAELGAKALPEFAAQYQDALWIAPLVQIQVSPTMRISGGAAYPLKVTNGFGGMSYLAQISTKF